MVRVAVPEKSAARPGPTYGWRSEPRRAPDGLVFEQVVLAPQYQTHVVSETAASGTYFSVGDETQVNAGEPIQPRTSLDITLTGQSPRGVLFEGGSYQTFEPFDPVVTRIITEDTDIDLWQTEPRFDFPDQWVPSWWPIVNESWSGEAVEHRLVVVPAQYRSQTAGIGIERRFDVMTYTVYYSNTADIIPPSVWRVEALPQQVAVEVEVTDWSDVIRVVAAYTVGAGAWRAVDLVEDAGNANLWTGSLPEASSLEWFVQAVDGCGNVAVVNNKGAYFGPPGSRIWLPLMVRKR